MPNRADCPELAGTSSKKRVAAVVALWATVMASVTIAAGCYGHICDGDTVIYGRNANEGHLIDPNTWESSAIDGDWLAFPKQRVYVVELHDLGDRLPEVIIPYVSAQANPIHDEGGNFVLAAGNLTEISDTEKGKVVLKNDTCADYYLRVVIQAAPRPTTPAVPTATPDAGSDAEAGP